MLIISKEFTAISLIYISLYFSPVLLCTKWISIFNARPSACLTWSHQVLCKHHHNHHWWWQQPITTNELLNFPFIICSAGNTTAEKLLQQPPCCKVWGIARTSNLEKHANWGIPDGSVKSVRQAPNNAKERTAFILRVEVSQTGNVTWYVREIIIIIIIIIFIYCNWVVTRWQWLFYMQTKHEIGYY